MRSLTPARSCWQRRVRSGFIPTGCAWKPVGVEEELHQLQSGESAPVDEPISFRQLVLFMDEEISVKIGFEKARNFDFSTIEKFDELLQPGHLDYLLPEPRGMVALRPRRTHKDYGYDDPFVNAMRNVPNMANTYFLIRDGENIYRIFTDRLSIPDRLFPRRDELQQMFTRVEEVMGSNRRESEKEELEDQMYRYRKQATFLQGLLDRTTVFGTLSEPINLFALNETTENRIRFIYDDDKNLTDGRLPYKKWVSALNESIQVGSRILIQDWLAGNWRNQKKDHLDRLWYQVGEYNAPELPTGGIYIVEAPPTPKYWYAWSSSREQVDAKIKATKAPIFRWGIVDLLVITRFN